MYQTPIRDPRISSSPGRAAILPVASRDFCHKVRAREKAVDEMGRATSRARRLWMKWGAQQATVTPGNESKTQTNSNMMK
jgi:hypothetical protein